MVTSFKTLLIISILVIIINRRLVFGKLKRRYFRPWEIYDRVPHLTNPNRRSNIKTILLWTPRGNTPFLHMGVGQQGFLDRNCLHVNCYVTSDERLLSDVTKFDVIAFSAKCLTKLTKSMLPKCRSPHQKYVFASTEPTPYDPLLEKYNGYFNWTWTYKLDSDLRWGSIVVTDLNYNVVGPAQNMNWIKRKDMSPVTKELKCILRRKTKAVAWIATKCSTPSKRELKVHELKNILKTKYDLDLDIFGDCGKRRIEEDCYEMIRSEYYFYLAYEQRLAEDYVTEELLPAVRYNAIPIVYGGANYSRFLPEGSYLNSEDFDTESLADKIYELMQDFPQYVEYFKWTNHYKYYSTLEHEDTNEYCKMCKLLNDEKKMESHSVFNNLTSWWNPNGSNFNRKRKGKPDVSRDAKHHKNVFDDFSRALGLSVVYDALKKYFSGVRDRFKLQQKLDEEYRPPKIR